MTTLKLHPPISTVGAPNPNKVIGYCLDPSEFQDIITRAKRMECPPRPIDLFMKLGITSSQSLEELQKLADKIYITYILPKITKPLSEPQYQRVAYHCIITATLAFYLEKKSTEYFNKEKKCVAAAKLFRALLSIPLNEIKNGYSKATIKKLKEIPAVSQFIGCSRLEELVELLEHIDRYHRHEYNFQLVHVDIFPLQEHCVTSNFESSDPSIIDFDEVLSPKKCLGQVLGLLGGSLACDLDLSKAAEIHNKIAETSHDREMRVLSQATTHRRF